MKLIIGLGNPGKQYDNTRHNVGFLVIDSILRESGGSLKKGNGPFEINKEPYREGNVILAKPTTFMNDSGRALQVLCSEFSLSPQDCLVIVDDVNLPLGKMRFRSKGSAGGHHGLESIIKALQSEDFPRLRIGVAQEDLTGADLTHFVLGPFSKGERELLAPQIERAGKACLDWLHTPPETLMQMYN